MCNEPAKRLVAAFDFDGTLTTRDTLLHFISYACGRWCFVGGFLLFAPLMLLMKLHLYPNGRCKERFFSWFFKGMPYADFVRLGETYADKVEGIRSEAVIRQLQDLKSRGATVYVVSASIEEWVRPFCRRIGVDRVLGTQVEVDAHGQLTGRFASPNCYGPEKVRRLQTIEPHRATYTLVAYGDSRGDAELLEWADEGSRV